MDALVIVAAISLPIAQRLVHVVERDDFVCLAGRIRDLRRVKHDGCASEIDLHQGTVACLAHRAGLGRERRKPLGRRSEDVGRREVDRGGEVDPASAADLRGRGLDGGGAGGLGQLRGEVDPQHLGHTALRGIGDDIEHVPILAGALIQWIGHDRGTGIFLEAGRPLDRLGQEERLRPEDNRLDVARQVRLAGRPGGSGVEQHRGESPRERQRSDNDGSCEPRVKHRHEPPRVPDRTW